MQFLRTPIPTSCSKTMSKGHSQVAHTFKPHTHTLSHSLLLALNHTTPFGHPPNKTKTNKTASRASTTSYGYPRAWTCSASARAFHTIALLVIAVKRDLGGLGLDVHVLEMRAVHLALLLLDRSAKLEQLLGHLQAQPEKVCVNNCPPSFLCRSALTLSQSSSFATGYGGSRGDGYRLPFFNPSPGALFFPTSRYSTLARKQPARSMH